MNPVLTSQKLYTILHHLTLHHLNPTLTPPFTPPEPSHHSGRQRRKSVNNNLTRSHHSTKNSNGGGGMSGGSTRLLSTITMVSIAPVKDSLKDLAYESSSSSSSSSNNNNNNNNNKSTLATPVLQCIDLTVCTPDGFRPLLGAIRMLLSDEKGGSNTAINRLGAPSLSSHIHAPSSSSLTVGGGGLGEGYGQNGGIAGSLTVQNSGTAGGGGPTRGVNFSIWEGDRVLVTGPSGTGKSSLLRAISGLWELGSGRIVWNTGKTPTSLTTTSTSNNDGSSSAPAAVLVPASGCANMNAPEGVFFLPQKPYNLLGSLRQQIAYPRHDTSYFSLL